MSINEDNELLNENFLYNDMLARALVQLFPAKERSRIHMWLERLQNIDGDTERQMTRNSYMWLLLLVLQNGNLIEPFNKNPPKDELPPIEEIMPAQLFEEMLSSGDRHLSWIDKLISETHIKDNKEASGNDGVPPHGFLEHQPQPVNGISCYFSVFSRPS